MKLYPIVKEAALSVRGSLASFRIDEAIENGDFKGLLNLWIQKRVVHDPLEAMAESLWRGVLNMNGDTLFSYPWTWQSLETKEKYREAVEHYFMPLWNDYEIDFNLTNMSNDKMYKVRKKK
jgi:hypothetical protein